MNLQEAFDAGFDAVKAYVDGALGDFEKRLVALEARRPEKGDKGEDGSDGKSVTVEEIRPMVEDVAARIVSEAKAMVRNYVDSRPLPKDGKDADPEQIASAVAKHLAENPPKPGEPGKDAEIAPSQIAEAVATYLKDNPPADGKNGTNGENGQSIKGDDGRGIKDALIDADGNLVLSFTDGELKTVGRVKGDRGEPGETPKDGIDGKDGLGFDDMTADVEDEGRVLVLRWSSGERKKEVRLTLGTAIYRGVFKEGETYERGDIVTWGGSGWHCNTETNEKPGDGSKNWTLAIKKGRDGKDGDKGPQGPQGKQGPPGLDRR